MKINVIGMGVMGYQVAALFYLLGYSVSVYSRREFDTKRFNRQVKLQNKIIGGFELDNKDVKICNDISEIYDACTIETTTEDLSTKKFLYNSVQQVTSKLFLTNTSSIEPREIGDNVIGLHFFNPIHIKLVEIASYKQHDEDLSQIIYDIKSAGFDIVEVKENRGYLANYVLFSEIGAVIKLMELYGYSYDSINTMYNNLYNGRDIFSILDLIGLDVAQNIFKNINEKDSSIYVPLCLDKAIKSGVFGKKNNTSILDVLDKTNNI